MRIGDTVTIYEDPYTELKPEGKAKLVKCLDNRYWVDDTRYEIWTVKFLSDGYVCERTIRNKPAPDKNKEALDSFFAKNI